LAEDSDPKDHPNIHVTREGGVQTIHIARPDKKNALTTAMYAAMVEALRVGEESDDIRVHLFKGEPGAFSAGNDIVDFLAAGESNGLGRDVVQFLKGLATADKPIVAAVDGLAIGIGTTMLLHCDLVYASPRSVFRTPFLDLGLVPEAGSSLLAPRLMGHARAFELLCLGESFDAPRAESAGIVNRVVPEDEVEAAALKASHSLAAKPRQALAAARRLVATGGVASRAELMARIDEEVALFAERLASDEARAAFAAFLGRKK
jgi:enoyl-CoA hydratase/carnithine racemase